VATVQAGRGPAAPRGAAMLGGDVLVADETGRASRVESEPAALVALARAGSIPGAQVWDVAADGASFLYVVDAERSLIVKLDQRGAAVATLGADWGMYRPRGLGIGPDGKLYVADTGRNRVVVANADGTLDRSIGPRTQSGELEQPTDVAVDDSGRIYVAVPELGRIFVIDADGQTLGGSSLTKGDTLESPRIAVVADGVVAVTEPRDRRVRIMDADGRELGTASLDDSRPFGVAAADGRLVVTDPSTGRVVVYALAPR
jgi:DNA-binding beta-propeller fold protein YncE